MATWTHPSMRHTRSGTLDVHSYFRGVRLRHGGRPIKNFKRMWRELFGLAGLDYGRSKGLTWHTIRHEFISRTLENTGDPAVAQELARHKDCGRHWDTCTRGGHASGRLQLA